MVNPKISKHQLNQAIFFIKLGSVPMMGPGSSSSLIIFPHQLSPIGDALPLKLEHSNHALNQ
jgi:hypothetical protein